MKWFKHYSDMHDGRSINNLMDELGHTGLCFFLLQEMCAEKFDGGDDEGATTFQFHPRIVRQKLRISSVKLKRLLDYCSTNGLLSFQFSENSLQISMPILLDLQARDEKNARKRRANTAQKPRLDIEIDKERETLANSALTSLSDKFKTAGPQINKRLKEQIKTPQDLADLTLAVTHYFKMLELPENNWREPKTSFQTFLGTKHSGYFWRDFIDPKSCKPTMRLTQSDIVGD